MYKDKKQLTELEVKNIQKKEWLSPELVKLEVKETKKDDWYVEDYRWNNLKPV